jgi:peptidoglycan/xylan/chitin deacetylase (PgdA/CDA1 family)
LQTLANQFVLQAVDSLGLNRYARWKRRRKLLILCYHAVVSDDSPLDDLRTNIAVTVSQFEQQLQHLHKHWNPVSMQEIRRYVVSDGKETLPDNAVFVSFDDGYRNNLTLVAPLLKKYNIPAAVFVTTGFIGTENKIFSALESQNLLMDSGLTQINVNDETFDLPEDRYERSAVCQQVAYRVKALPLDEHHQWLDRLRYDVGSMDISQTTEEYIHELQDF